MQVFRRKELRAIWGDESRMMAEYRRIWDSSPPLREFYRYLWGMAMVEAVGKPVVELGGGSGLIREYYPEVITSDFHLSPWTNLVCDATRLPFAAASVGSFVGVAFFHHCPNPRCLFTEVQRALVPGGRCIIVDPYIGPLSRFVYRFATEESLDLAEPPFETTSRVSARPLLDANVARATILFERHRPLFERTFPGLRVVRVEPVNLFRHITAGSCVQKSPFPNWCYPLVSLLDSALKPLRRLTAMAMTIVLEKDRP